MFLSLHFLENWFHLYCQVRTVTLWYLKSSLCAKLLWSDAQILGQGHYGQIYALWTSWKKLVYQSRLVKVQVSNWSVHVNYQQSTNNISVSYSKFSDSSKILNLIIFSIWWLWGIQGKGTLSSTISKISYGKCPILILEVNTGRKHVENLKLATSCCFGQLKTFLFGSGYSVGFGDICYVCFCQLIHLDERRITWHASQTNDFHLYCTVKF